jgi:hypothetical protein
LSELEITCPPLTRTKITPEAYARTCMTARGIGPLGLRRAT